MNRQSAFLLGIYRWNGTGLRIAAFLIWYDIIIFKWLINGRCWFTMGTQELRQYKKEITKYSYLASYSIAPIEIPKKKHQKKSHKINICYWLKDQQIFVTWCGIQSYMLTHIFRLKCSLNMNSIARRWFICIYWLI